jgi:two-component system NtrC family sensor kinase
LLKDLAPDDTRWDDLNVIASEVSRLEFIVNEVLGYARYAKPQMAPGDLSSLVSKVLQTFNTDWTFDNVCVDAVLDTQLPMVNMDANQIKQVLINVLLNAAQAMPKGGRILVTTKLKDQDLELLVADTGHGIPEHLWDKVFAPFFTTKTSGAGLGLNIASQIIAAHGGNIQFESAPGKGTTFRITLPRAKENGSS